jgi:hypothetical protein
VTGVPAKGGDLRVGQTFDWAPGRLTLAEVRHPLTNNGKRARYVITTDADGQPLPDADARAGS